MDEILVARGERGDKKEAGRRLQFRAAKDTGRQRREGAIVAMASMEHRYKKHYSLEEARKLLPSVRKWLKQIGQLRKDLRKLDSQLEKLVAPGVDLGGKVVNTWVRANVNLRDLLLEFF